MNDEDPDIVNTKLHLQPFEVGVNGARLMAQTIHSLLEWPTGRAHFGYAEFVFSRGGGEVMIFFFTNVARGEMVRVLKEFVRIQEDQ